MGKQEDFLKSLITRDYTVTEFADISGLNRSNFYNWFKNMDSMPVSALRAISKALNVSANELVMCDWETAQHIEVCTDEENALLTAFREGKPVELCTDEELALLKVYRENGTLHELINKMIS